MAEDTHVPVIRMPRSHAMRNWRNQFHEAADYIWRREKLFGGVVHKPGDPVDKKKLGRVKLRGLWASGHIDLDPACVPTKKSTAQMIAEMEAKKAAEAAGAGDEGEQTEGEEPVNGGGSDE